MVDIAQLYKEINGRHLTVTGDDADECTAVPHRFQQLNNTPIVYGNAIDIFNNAPSNLYDKVHYTPGKQPPRNAIVVWGANTVVGTGSFGHVGVANGETRLDGRFQSLDQNWPTGAVCGLVWHTFDGVIGWLILKSLNKQQEAQDMSDLADNYFVEACAEGFLGRTAKDDTNLLNNVGRPKSEVLDTFRFYPEAVARRKKADAPAGQLSDAAVIAYIKERLGQ